MNIPDEAVQAAISAYGKSNGLAFKDQIHAALTAALPFMQGVKVTDLQWFDCAAQTPFGEYTIQFDDDEEMHETPYCLGSPSDNLGHYSDEEAAKSAAQADYEARVLSAIEVTPSPRAQALEEAAILEALEECETYFDDRSDADHDETGFVPNEEMRILVSVRAAIRALSSQPVADGWLPIETAPKDGTPFLVFVPDDKFSDGTGIDVIWYDEEQWLFGSNTPFNPANNPTHWRPLPASPGASE